MGLLIILIVVDCVAAVSLFALHNMEGGVGWAFVAVWTYLYLQKEMAERRG